MTVRSRGGRGDIEKFFEFARQRDERPALKPLNYTFEPARRPDMIIPERPRGDISAADVALRQIKDYASKARELYRERRKNERPTEAREYVRHQLALGMLDAPMRRGRRADLQLGRVSEPAIEPAPAEREPERKSRRFGFWRRAGKPY